MSGRAVGRGGQGEAISSRRGPRRPGATLGAAKRLDEAGISAEVADPRTTWPLDKQTLIDSAKTTARALRSSESARAIAAC